MVSVIVPVYQVEKYLNKCISSICAQDYKNLEIILVDDGSTDGSAKICDDYADVDSRIVVIHKVNEGLSAARNTGLDKAHGEYIVFVDSDDWIDSRYISSLLEVCEKFNCQICQCGFVRVPDEETTLFDDVYSPILFTADEFLYSEFLLMSWECVISWNKMYRSDLFQSIRFPVGKINEDEATTYKLVANSDRIGAISARLYYYRYREESIVNTASISSLEPKNDAFIERAKYYYDNDREELGNLVKARHLQWISDAIKTYKNTTVQDNRCFNSFLDERERLIEENANLSLPRKDFFKRQTIFPFDRVEKGSRVLLYGGGKAGQQFFLQVKATNYCSIEAWVDKDYIKLNKRGIPVRNLDYIGQKCKICDHFIIAIKEVSSANAVKSMLISTYDIAPEKIIYTFNTTLGIL